MPGGRIHPLPACGFGARRRHRHRPAGQGLGLWHAAGCRTPGPAPQRAGGRRRAGRDRQER